MEAANSRAEERQQQTLSARVPWVGALVGEATLVNCTLDPPLLVPVVSDGSANTTNVHAKDARNTGALQTKYIYMYMDIIIIKYILQMHI